MNLQEYMSEHPALLIVADEAFAIDSQSGALHMMAIPLDEMQEMIEAMVISARHLLANAEQLKQDFEGHYVPEGQPVHDPAEAATNSDDWQGEEDYGKPYPSISGLVEQEPYDITEEGEGLFY